MINRTRPRGIAAVIILLVVVVLLAGCGGQEEEAAQPPKESPVLLPSLTVKLSEEGTPTILGISPKLLATVLRQDVSAFSVPTDTVKQLMDAGVQHLEFVVAGNGLYIFINGQPMPYLVMDEQTRQSVGELLKLAGADDRMAKNVQNLLNNKFIARLGVPLVVKLPVPEGVAEIPVREKGSMPLVVTEEARAAVTDPSLIAHVDLAVDDQGVPTIAGTSMAEMQAAFESAGLAADLSGIRMDPATVADLTGRGIHLVQVETEPEGVYLYVNGNRLPRVAYDQVRLQNALGLYGKLQPENPNVPLLTFFEPYIQPADVELSLFLPGSEGITPSSFVE
jgi:hypothetical protein